MAADTPPADTGTTLPAEVLHRLLHAYAAARWPNADHHREATYLAADPIYGGDPELVTLIRSAYAAGRASVLDQSSARAAERIARDARQALGIEAIAVRRHVTPWEPAGGEGA